MLVLNLSRPPYYDDRFLKGPSDVYSSSEDSISILETETASAWASDSSELKQLSLSLEEDLPETVSAWGSELEG